MARVDPQIFERHFPNWGRERKARLNAGGNDTIRRVPSAPPITAKSKASTTSLGDEACESNSANDSGSYYDTADDVPVPNPTPSIPVLAESTVLWRVKSRPRGNEQVNIF